MRKKLIISSITLCLILLVSNNAQSWGFFAHRKINRLAVFTLPDEMIGFYKEHIEFLTEHAVDPDKRRYAVEGEAPRHYIDIDHYGEGMEVFKKMPRNYYDAINLYTEDTIQAYGIVPWHIGKMMKRLTKAFKEENLDRILHYSADLGHYCGDSHVPLHTTENYNGDMSGQHGIHGFWESRLPELFAVDFDFFVGKAEYLDSPLDKAWETVEDSHRALDSVFDFEKELNKNFPQDQKYSHETRGRTTMRTYSREYAAAFSKSLNGMVERRMRKAIITAGSYWYTAWVNAGQPDLSRLGKSISSNMIKEFDYENSMWRTGKIRGRNHTD